MFSKCSNWLRVKIRVFDSEPYEDNTCLNRKIPINGDPLGLILYQSITSTIGRKYEDLNFGAVNDFGCLLLSLLGAPRQRFQHLLQVQVLQCIQRDDQS